MGTGREAGPPPAPPDEEPQGETNELDIPPNVGGWSPDGRYVLGQAPAGIMTVVDVNDPTAPVATEFDDATEFSWTGWQPRP